jgi:hypothetical protein
MKGIHVFNKADLLPIKREKHSIDATVFRRTIDSVRAVAPNVTEFSPPDFILWTHLKAHVYCIVSHNLGNLEQRSNMEFR